ncbi:3-methyladenine DNA glycosylase AlkC [Gracilibacillus orientalis]|uniref:3-methyladenine DNA glycosylase AlkC n=1 Tax=Gracilibacillus orientalis TaxID=334253 RepID=A0A1I4NVM2_9BACI|nr:DNA alkylation repair protein [Gracilibacillus orientalis]SFM19588.1 3-methyladenine DNA glycosylase AlkC [Gracilibacillus orientalis]
MSTPLKDMYSSEFFERFTAKVKSHYPLFDKTRFIETIFDENWKGLELKQRMRHISIAIFETFPPSYEEAVQLLMNMAPQCRGFEYLFFPDFVERYGIEYWDTSMTALEEFTKYSSSEFAVRPFIIKNPSKMMEQMLDWSRHEDEHVRRLASEGCRPKLPWAAPLKRFQNDPSEIIPILEELKQDPSKYVQKSVANNLNDISKDHPALVKQIVHKWSGNDSVTDWILKHGSRSLLKKGDVEALRLFGYVSAKEITVEDLVLSQEQFSLGDTMEFSFQIRNESTQPIKLRIEYAIDFVKANGKQNRKIFKLSDKHYSDETVSILRKHAWKDLSTRKHYSGVHTVTIVVNGEEKASTEFVLQT